jgi:hypothetical protein
MNVKKIVLWILLLGYGSACVLLYLNAHFYLVSNDVEDGEQKIRLLNMANIYYPFNDMVFYELGKSSLELGIQNLIDREKSESYLQNAISYLTMSIKLNPASQFSHYFLAKSAIYMNTFSNLSNIKPFEELKKATLLVDRNSQIFFEVGKMYLSYWHELSPDDRDFSLGLLKDIIDESDQNQILNLMHVWEMTVKDYSILEKILPNDPNGIRIFADYLGERSLSLEMRHDLLAKAESMEFERARMNFQIGENEFLYYRLDNAVSRFNACLRILDRIRFYQSLTTQILFDTSEYYQLKRKCYLNLIKCQLEGGKSVKDVEELIVAYLSIEDRIDEIEKFESYLTNKGFISESISERFDDLGSLSIQLIISFKQSRYLEIMRVGRLFQQSFVVVPEEEKKHYITILEIFGDAFQRSDYNYDAEQYYTKALESDPENLLILIKLRSNYERLNNNRKVRELNQRIDNSMSSKEIKLKRDRVFKGRMPSTSIALDGKDIIVDIAIKEGLGGIPPIMAVFMNGQVVWEDFLMDKTLSLPLKTVQGENHFQVYAINKDIVLENIRYRFAN